MSLATKYRSKKFSEVVGQKAAVQIVEAIGAKREPQVLLLQGQRGIGKTTLARIFAKSLNCEYGTKLCGECLSCKAFDKGSHPDCVEVDVGSSGLVADARKLIIQARVVPAWKVRVFILDEIHSGSADFFDALLALFEDPPKTAYFVGCTTNPTAVPLTISSRCLIIELNPISSTVIQSRLAEIVGLEGFRFEDKVLQAISRYSDGSMRDAIMALERLMLRAKDKFLSSDLLEMENWHVSSGKILNILKSLLSRNLKLYKESIQIESRLEATNVLYAVLDRLSRFYLKEGRRSDSLIEAVWKGYIRLKRGADPSLVFQAIWLDTENT